MKSGRWVVRGMLAFALVTGWSSSPASAANVLSGADVILATGGSRADYLSTYILGSFRGGLGLRFFEHVGIGTQFHADRAEKFFFGYLMLFLNPYARRTPFDLYARAEYGRPSGRWHTDAVAWSVGISVGTPAYRFFAEHNHIDQPNTVDSIHLGVLYYARRSSGFGQ